MTLAAVVLLSTAPLLASDRLQLVERNGFTRVEVVEVEIDAGAVVQLDRTNLEALTPVSYTRAYGLARVGARLWMATDDGVLRYDEDAASGYVWLDRVLAGRTCRGVWPDAGGALVQEADVQTNLLHRVDAAGSIQQSVPFGFALDDIVGFQGGYLAISSFGIVRLDASFNVVGRFAAGAPAVAASMGLGYTPTALSVLSDGRIAVSAFSSVAILRPDGSVDGIVDVGQFERGARESAGGLLVVPCLDETRLLDPDTLEVFRVGGALDGEAWDFVLTPTPASVPPFSSRYCTSLANSTGAAARIHLLGATDASERTLSALATRMPAGSFALPIFGTAAFDGPYGDGRLCVSPFQANLTRGFAVGVSATGSAQATFDFQTPPTGAAFLPGTTWYVQFVYRDGGGTSGLNATDGASITFRP